MPYWLWQKNNLNSAASKKSQTSHPYIIGSECDVSSMQGYWKTTMRKVITMTGCGCKHLVD